MGEVNAFWHKLKFDIKFNKFSDWEFFELKKDKSELHLNEEKIVFQCIKEKYLLTNKLLAFGSRKKIKDVVDLYYLLNKKQEILRTYFADEISFNKQEDKNFNNFFENIEQSFWKEEILWCFDNLIKKARDLEGQYNKTNKKLYEKFSSLEDFKEKFIQRVEEYFEELQKQEEENNDFLILPDEEIFFDEKTILRKEIEEFLKELNWKKKSTISKSTLKNYKIFIGYFNRMKDYKYILLDEFWELVEEFALKKDLVDYIVNNKEKIW